MYLGKEKTGLEGRKEFLGHEEAWQLLNLQRAASVMTSPWIMTLIFGFWQVCVSEGGRGACNIMKAIFPASISAFSSSGLNLVLAACLAKQMDAQNWCQSIYYVARNKLSCWLLSSAEKCCWPYVLNIGWQEQRLFHGWEGTINHLKGTMC